MAMKRLVRPSLRSCVSYSRIRTLKCISSLRTEKILYSRPYYTSSFTLYSEEAESEEVAEDPVDELRDESEDDKPDKDKGFVRVPVRVSKYNPISKDDLWDDLPKTQLLPLLDFIYKELENQHAIFYEHTYREFELLFRYRLEDNSEVELLIDQFKRLELPAGNFLILSAFRCALTISELIEEFSNFGSIPEAYDYYLKKFIDIGSPQCSSLLIAEMFKDNLELPPNSVFYEVLDIAQNRGDIQSVRRMLKVMFSDSRNPKNRTDFFSPGVQQEMLTHYDSVINAPEEETSSASHQAYIDSIVEIHNKHIAMKAKFDEIAKTTDWSKVKLNINTDGMLEKPSIKLWRIVRKTIETRNKMLNGNMVVPKTKIEESIEKNMFLNNPWNLWTVSSRFAYIL